MRVIPIAVLCILLSGCTGLPEGVHPVEGFESERYLGKWYEIARLDHSFERGLESVTAEYLQLDDGIKVVNRGFSAADGEWKQAEGKAYFVDGDDKGHLKVSFFGPFYGSYVVFELDKKDYRYAFVSGYDKNFLWLLSRTSVVSDDLIGRFVDRAKALGFDTDNLIFVDHKN